MAGILARRYFIEQTFDWLRPGVGPINMGLDQPSGESFLVTVQEQTLISLQSNINQPSSAFINMAHRGVEKMRNQLGMVIV